MRTTTTAGGCDHQSVRTDATRYPPPRTRLRVPKADLELEVTPRLLIGEAG